MNKKIIVCIPTYNPGKEWPLLIKSLVNQSIYHHIDILIIDSSSDNGIKIPKKNNFKLLTIPKNEFNHGGTRQKAIDLYKDYDFAIFLTQDAILEKNNSIEKLLESFNDTSISAAYGRQLAHTGAKEIEIHARLFNYPMKSRKSNLSTAEKHGAKNVFISNSFAAYNIKDLLATGGFPDNVILGEDTIVASKLINIGNSILYNHTAAVYHSHSYSIIQEFKRYFDTGVLHTQESGYFSRKNNISNEGFKFMKSELRFLINHKKYHLLGKSFISSLIKYIAYNLGKNEEKIPIAIKKKLSMHSFYWNS